MPLDFCPPSETPCQSGCRPASTAAPREPPTAPALSAAARERQGDEHEDEHAVRVLLWVGVSRTGHRGSRGAGPAVRAGVRQLIKGRKGFGPTQLLSR